MLLKQIFSIGGVYLPLGCLHQIDQLKVRSARNSGFYFLVVNQSESEAERILLVNTELTEFERLRSSVLKEPLYGKMALVAQVYLYHI